MAAGKFHPTVFFNFGPGDHPYLSGFEPMWEIDPDGLATHWSSYQSAVALPLGFAGGRARLSYRFSRVYGQTAVVEVRVKDVPVDEFTVRGGQYLERTVEIPESLLSPGPLIVEIVADSHEGKNRGLRMDWLRVEALERGRVTPEATTSFWCATLAFLFYLTCLLTTRSVGRAVAADLGLVIAFFLYGGLAGPFPLAHLMAFVAPAALALLLAAIACLAMFDRVFGAGAGAARWLPALTVAAFLIRAGGLFHPLFYYPDLRAHADLARIVSEVGLDFWLRPAQYISEQGVWAEQALGRTYAFPFSPVFHALFAPLAGNLLATIEAMKLLACFLSALEVPVVFYLGRRLASEEVGAWGAALSLISPPALSRLSYAFLAAVFAHFLDSLFLLSLSRRAGMASAVLLLLALASYPGSLINFGLFLPLYAAALLIAPASRREGFLVLAGSAVVAGVVLLAVYLEFLGVFLTDMLPRFLAGESRAGSFGLLPAVAMLFHRLWIFYDGLYIPLIASGLFLWMRKRTGLPRGFLICWGVVFLLLIFMRSAMPDLFSRVKEMLWVAPLVSLLSAEALAGVRRSLPAGRLLAPLYFFLLAAYGVGYYAALIGERFALAR
jgi:hypothetical protein